MIKKQLKIAFLGAEGVPYPNAFAKITDEIGSRLVERGHDVIVYCRSHFVSDDSPYRGMQRIVLPSINTKHLDTFSFTLLATLDLLTKRKVDIAHFHGIGPSIFSIIPRLKKQKTVVQIHSLDWQRAKWGRFARAYLKASEFSALYFPNATVVVSETLRKYYKDQYNHSTCFIPQGVDNANIVSPNEIERLGLKGNDYILFMARLVPEKGCHYLIKAFRELETDKKLIIAGGVAHSDDYVIILHREGADDDRIVFTGHVTGNLKTELLSNAYLYVLPSELEGLSLGLLEAMGYGNCVVVSDIPENLEAISKHGFTFKNGDYRSLKQTLQSLLSSPELVSAQKKTAKDYAQSNYSWDVVTDRLEELYYSLL